MEKIYRMISNFSILTDDIQHLSAEACEKLQCGDKVVKLTVEGDKELYHTYFVTHKQATGMCITYFACGYLETISFDKVDGEWQAGEKEVWQAQ